MSDFGAQIFTDAACIARDQAAALRQAAPAPARVPIAAVTREPIVVRAVRALDPDDALELLMEALVVHGSLHTLASQELERLAASPFLATDDLEGRRRHAEFLRDQAFHDKRAVAETIRGMFRQARATATAPIVPFSRAQERTLLGSGE